MEQLSKLFSSTGLGISASANVATQSIALSSLAASSAPWIIDSSASNHMTGRRNLFTSFIACSMGHAVEIANRSLIDVTGTGSISLNSHITLSNVLYVPQLSCNNMSISKLTADLRCSVQFTYSFCLFRDPVSNQTIGHAKERLSLYYFEWEPAGCVCQVAISSRSFSRRKKYLLLYYRLGHPSFIYLRHLFPSLFHSGDGFFFFFETCELAKHRLFPFLS